MDGFTLGEEPQYQLNRRMYGPLIWSGCLGGGGKFYPCQDSKAGLFSPWSSLYTSYDISVAVLLFRYLFSFQLIYCLNEHMPVAQKKKWQKLIIFTSLR
jgi:hypothetical protein